MKREDVYHVVKKEFECSHRNGKLTYKVSSNGATTWRLQCVHCGECIRTIPKANLSQEDIQSADEWDEDARQHHLTEMSNRRELLHAQINEEESRTRDREYSAYLLSPAWRALRAKVLKRDNYTCQGCLNASATQVHHRTYERIYSEMLFDLVSVCDACHKKIHAD